MELDILAMAGAAALVQAATTEAWGTVSRQVAGVLSRGNQSRRAVIEHQLVRTHEVLGSSPGEESAAAEEKTWAMRLADLLAERPESRPELQELVDTLRPPQSGVTIGDHAFVVMQNHGEAHQTNNFGPSSPSR
ncbi:hypothetical protein ACWT_3294 [Actinoplanes sp. SE50]|uniref:hypothetical protein n=1 Tax=unclassified Actinoplanes TaxID=2626549 RepID=UPI00023ECCB6|nr:MULTISPECIES: hypothetical protein [unclassified Actinoplanes]AEV84317.1 hypothetical protein ACPL_3422 [Actinoplanes sp. SE50/110]ATO82709.1 hypothetical protein ACWT_3294 [Actinoplanes sp. SE50]SLM00116.1 hypothetical protein ACSP50_3348 [Actinoplanes sp. SE50/110]